MLARAPSARAQDATEPAPAETPPEQAPVVDPPPPPPPDHIRNPPQRGPWTTFDAYTVGVQASIERRIPIERDDYAAIVPKLSALASLGFGEVAGHVDGRFLFFSFGGSFGVRRVWRTYAFPEGTEGTRDARLEVDDKKAFTTENWLFGEARVRMVLPVLDSVLVATSATVRWEGCPDNSFDWFHTTMHDRGFLFRYDASVLFRSPGFGALGPTFRAMELPRGGRYESELAVGFTFGRRLGIFKENDLLLLNVLTRPGDPSFGFQILRLPLYVLAAYRVSFNL